MALGPWFRPALRRAALVDVSPSDFMPDNRSILDNGMAAVGKLLGDLRRDEITLEVEIADKTERLRQTRIAIAAFDGAEKTLQAGQQKPNAAEVEAPMESRLVPRGLPKGRAA